jgi:hypothetical protein
LPFWLRRHRPKRIYVHTASKNSENCKLFLYCSEELVNSANSVQLKVTKKLNNFLRSSKGKGKTKFAEFTIFAVLRCSLKINSLQAMKSEPEMQSNASASLQNPPQILLQLQLTSAKE